MKNNIIILLYLLCAWLGMGSSCKDKEPVTPTPKSYFTCKINGMEYKPSGYNGTPNYSIDIDPNYSSGVFSIVTYNYIGNDREYTLGFGSDSLKNTGVYMINKNSRNKMLCANQIYNCEYYSYKQEVNILSGFFTIDIYDLENFIFSGQFEAMMAKTDGCDTLHITEGKFYYRQ